jgi:hypothetical protein
LDSRPTRKRRMLPSCMTSSTCRIVSIELVFWGSSNAEIWRGSNTTFRSWNWNELVYSLRLIFQAFWNWAGKWQGSLSMFYACECFCALAQSKTFFVSSCTAPTIYIW